MRPRIRGRAGCSGCVQRDDGRLRRLPGGAVMRRRGGGARALRLLAGVLLAEWRRDGVCGHVGCMHAVRRWQRVCRRVRRSGPLRRGLRVRRCECVAAGGGVRGWQLLRLWFRGACGVPRGDLRRWAHTHIKCLQRAVRQRIFLHSRGHERHFRRLPRRPICFRTWRRERCVRGTVHGGTLLPHGIDREHRETRRDGCKLHGGRGLPVCRRLLLRRVVDCGNQRRVFGRVLLPRKVNRKHGKARR